MRLISTMWETIKWKKILFWYFIGMVAIALTYFDGRELVAIILGGLSIHSIILVIILRVWNKVIYRHTEGFPVIWIWAYVVPDIKVFDNNANLYEMKNWCCENCQGKWIHCEHGYFAFKQKNDLVAFKLRWI